MCASSHITTEANDLKEWLEVTFYALVLHDHIRGHIYEDSLLALCALKGSGRWAASSPDACVRAEAVRTRSGVGALSQEGSGVGALNML